MGRRGVSIDEAVAAAATHPDVIAAMQRRAQHVLVRARYAAYQAGRVNFGDALTVESGVRPGVKAARGLRRPFVRVVAAITPAQHAADSRRAKLSRTEILRRSAR